MGIKVTITQAAKKFGKVGDNVLKLSKRQGEQLEDFLLKKSRETRDDIIDSMRKTPKAPWSYKRGKRQHHPSLPFNPPAIDEGNLWTHIDFDAHTKGPDFGVELGTDVIYGAYLEEGTESSSGKIIMEPRPWLVPAVEKKEPEIIKGINDIIGVELDRAFRVLERG